MSRSSGSTCGARARTAALITLAGLLLSVFLPISSALGATPAPTAATIPLSLGFSPSSLTPVSDGVPVYTAGDTIWALSNFSYSVPISVTSAKPPTPSSTDIVSSWMLPPGVITPLYTFTPDAVDGLWNVTVVTLGGAVVVPVRFVNLAAHPVSLSPLAYSLIGGNLSISSQASLGDSYDQQVCAAGVATQAGVTVGLPASMEPIANITVTPAASSVGVRAAGNITQPFSVWFELYHPYSLDVTSANSLVVSNLLAASSQPIAFASAGSGNATLTWNTPMRVGRYDLRAYFQNSTNLQLVQSSLLILNDSSWVSLSNACQPEPVTSQSISYSASLAKALRRGPRRYTSCTGPSASKTSPLTLSRPTWPA